MTEQKPAESLVLTGVNSRSSLANFANRFVIKKISNYGTSHPIVARLQIQTHELVQFSDIPKDRKDRVTAIYFRMAERLLKCHEAHDRAIAALQKTSNEFKPTPDARMMNAPHVIGLESEAETFLQEGKNFLRDLVGVLNVFFGTDFDEASAFYNPKGRDGKLVEWATAKFGPNEPFTAMLVYEQCWVGELIRKRNAVEHPGGYSGALHINNFQPLPDGRFVMPTWHRDDNPPADIFSDLDVCLDNLLTLAEDILVACIVHTMQHKIIQFGEIPENERDPKCPIRLRATLNQAAMGPSIPAEPPKPA